MATNKNALIRYKTIDKCLQNRNRRWTLEDLIDACSEALYEYEGKDCMVSKRTVQLDIQLMRSNKLGYEAPIICYNKKFYTYEDEDYSITNVPITKIDLDILDESMIVLAQFKDFSLFSELNGIIQKLEDKIYRESKSDKPIIHMDSNENLVGLEHLDTLYKAVLKKIVLKIHYKSFKARSETIMTFHPFILKEYNNRWFVVGRNHKSEGILTLALDRISKIDYDLKVEYDDCNFDADEYYKNTIGVTVLNDSQLFDITFKANASNAPYIATKPFHRSQEIIETHDDQSITFKMRVHLNQELERLLLGFGEGITVLSPGLLVRNLRYKLKKSLEFYSKKNNLMTSKTDVLSYTTILK